MSNLHEMTPRVLGRGLMRGDRAEEKLGYCAQDAVHAVCRLHDLNEAETAALEAYLDGFSARMRRKPTRRWPSGFAASAPSPTRKAPPTG